MPPAHLKFIYKPTLAKTNAFIGAGFIRDQVDWGASETLFMDVSPTRMKKEFVRITWRKYLFCDGLDKTVKDNTTGSIMCRLNFD